MKKIYIFNLILIIFCFILLIIVLLLLKENRNRFNLDNYNKLCNTMSLNIENELLNGYVGGGIGEKYWEDEVDSLYFHLDKIRNSNSFYDYRSIKSFYHISKRDMIDDILRSFDKSNTKEKEFIISFLKYLSLEEMLSMRLKNYYPFDRMVIYEKAFSLKGDTIKLGDEYIAAAPIVMCNSEYDPTLVLDGDTFPVKNGLNTFSIITNKRGSVKKEGFITFFDKGEENRIPIVVEYYVK